MNIELKGTVHSIGEVEQKTDKFKTRELIITYSDNPQYPQYRKLEAVQDKVNLLDGLKLGQEVTCQVNPNGRIWIDPNGVEKCFNADHVWKIEANTFNSEGDVEVVPNGEDLPF